MKSKMKVVLISLVAALVLIVGGLFVVVSKKISPEEIKKIALGSLQSTFPNADVEIGNIDYSIGLSVKIGVDKVGIALKKGRGKLFNVENMQVKIPIWAIITSGGSIDVKLEKPELYYKEIGQSHNWKEAMGDGPAKAEAPKTTGDAQTASTTEKNIAIPAFVSRSKLNLKLTDLLVQYELKDGGEGKITLSRFLVKNLNIATSTAFELASNIDVELSKTRKVSLETLVIGQFNLADYLKEKRLPLEVVVELKRLSVSDLPYKIPDLKTEIKTVLAANGTLSGDVVTTFLASRIGLSFALDQAQTKLTNLSSEISLEDIFEILAMKGSGLDHNKSKITLGGSLAMKKSDGGGIVADLSVQLAPGVVVDFDGEKITTAVKASLKRGELNANVSTSLLGGVIESDFNLPLDLKKPEVDIAKLPPFLLKVKASNLNLPKEKIQKMLYAKKEGGAKVEKSETKEAAPKTTVAEAKPVNLPHGKIIFGMENVKIDNEKLTAKGDFSVGGNRFDIKSFNFKYADGSGDLTNSITLLPASTNLVLDFKLSSLNLRGISPFLPPMVEGVTGIFSGTVKGSVVSSPKFLKHDIAVDVTAKNGEIKGIDISEKINLVLAKVPMLKEKLGDQAVKVPSNFDNFVFQGKFKEDHYALNKILFIGAGKMVEITGNGNLYPLSTKDEGIVDLDYIDGSGKIGPLLEKNVGTKILPVRLKGIGLALMPDYAYTAGKLAKGAIATKGKEKLQDLAGKLLKSKSGEGDQKKSPINEVLKNKKVDSLMKGFFK